MPEIPEGATPFEDVINTLDATSGVELKAGSVGQFVYQISLSVLTANSVEMRLADGTVIGLDKPLDESFTNDSLWADPIENTGGIFLYATSPGEINATITGYTIGE